MAVAVGCIIYSTLVTEKKLDCQFSTASLKISTDYKDLKHQLCAVTAVYVKFWCEDQFGHRSCLGVRVSCF